MKIEEAWDLQLRWSAQGGAHALCVLDLRARVEALEQRATVKDSLIVEQAQEWIKRRIYRNSTEYSEYVKQRFQYRTGSSFEFDGHRWQYEYSSFDDTGEYDLIHRPPEPAPAPAAAAWEPTPLPGDSEGLAEVFWAEPEAEPAPAPAADRLKSLQEVMREAYVLAGSDGPGFTAEIDAVADWLAVRGCAGSADMLRTEARRAREGA